MNYYIKIYIILYYILYIILLIHCANRTLELYSWTHIEIIVFSCTVTLAQCILSNTSSSVCVSSTLAQCILSNTSTLAQCILSNTVTLAQCVCVKSHRLGGTVKKNAEWVIHSTRTGSTQFSDATRIAFCLLFACYSIGPILVQCTNNTRAITILVHKIHSVRTVTVRRTVTTYAVQCTLCVFYTT